MDVTEMRARLADIADELDTFVINEPDDEARFNELETEADGLMESIAAVEARDAARARVRDAVASGAARIESGSIVDPVVDRSKDPFDLSDIRGIPTASELRARATSAVESVDGVDDTAKGEIVRKLERMDDVRGVLPQLVLATSTPAYRSAFVKAMAGRETLWSNEERLAVARANEVRTALGLTESGYAAPAVVDPTVILTSDGSANPIRQIARVESVTSNTWKPLLSAGITAGFGAPGTQATDNTPTVSQPSITAEKAQAFARGEIEVVEDWVGLGAELGREFAEAKDDLEATAFVTGTGTDEPTGIVAALGGGNVLAPATAETFALADVYALIEDIAPKFRGSPRFAWLAELSTINAIRQFATANNYHGFLTDLAGDTPRQLLGKALYEASAMDPASGIDAGATADNKILLAGDWSKFVVVDRIGLSVEFIPHLFGTTANYPSGERGWYCHWRVGSDSILDKAFRVLNVATAE